jgi:hypothetical protein
MSRKLVALLFVGFFVALVAYGALVTPLGVLRHEGPAGFIGEAIGRGLLIYFESGVLPFAVWGARGFRTANARSLFIPWAILAGLVIALEEYGRSPP